MPLAMLPMIVVYVMEVNRLTTGLENFEIKELREFVEFKISVDGMGFQLFCLFTKIAPHEREHIPHHFITKTFSLHLTF